MSNEYTDGSLTLDDDVKQSGGGPKLAHWHNRDQLAWIGKILTGGNEDAELRTSRGEPGWQQVARFAILPGRSNPRFLVPLEHRKASGRALQVYNAQKPVARVCRQLLATGLRTGLAQPFLRSRATLWVHRQAASQDKLLLVTYLRKVLGRDDISVAVSFGTRGVHQKPVLQIVSHEGKTLGYAKVGWSQRTIALLRNEENTLSGLAETPFSATFVPRILHAGFWNNLYVLVQDTAPGTPKPSPWKLDRRHLAFLAELYGAFPSSRLTWSELDSSLESALAEIPAAGSHDYVHLLQSAMRYYRERTAPELVPCGLEHGDFTPWNIRVCGDKLLVIDWEFAARLTPPGWDLFHFLVESAVELQGAPAAEIHRRILYPGTVSRQIREYFQKIGVPSTWIQPSYVAYLARSLSRNLAQTATLDDKDRELRSIFCTLLSLACHEGVDTR